MTRQPFIRTLFARDALLFGFCAFIASLCFFFISMLFDNKTISQTSIIVTIGFSILPLLMAMFSYASLDLGQNQFKIKRVWLASIMTTLYFPLATFLLISTFALIAQTSFAHQHLEIATQKNTLDFFKGIGLLCVVIITVISCAAIPGTLLYILLYKLLRFDKPKPVPTETTTP